jgi:hypothetical protein
MKLGLDELIIVNPGSPPFDSAHGKPAETSWFLGADGGLYRLDHALHDAALGSAEPVPRFFLGDDGILYETR